MRRIFLIVGLCVGCSRSAAPMLAAAPAHPPLAAPASPDEQPPPARACPRLPAPIGRIQDAELDEISGVVESRKNPQVLFVHNDSGESPRFFAIDRQGRLLATLRLSNVPLVLDAEDIALGPAPGGDHFIYLGDTGNNLASSGLGIPRRKAVLYRVPEPNVPLAARGLELSLPAFRIVLTFPDGARDVEALFIEPSSGDLFLISKQRDGRSQVLTASAALLAAGGGALTLAGELRFGQGALGPSTLPTAASIARDGSAILVRTYSSALLFRRERGETVMSALRRAPEQLAAPNEAQGEAIGFVDGDRAFVTISEGPHPIIHCGQLAR